MPFSDLYQAAAGSATLTAESAYIQMACSSAEIHRHPYPSIFSIEF